MKRPSYLMALIEEMGRQFARPVGVKLRKLTHPFFFGGVGGGGGTRWPLLVGGRDGGGVGRTTPTFKGLGAGLDLSAINQGRFFDTNKTIATTPAINKGPAEQFSTFVTRLNRPPSNSR